MKKSLWIGVDGGGTKCIVRVEDENGRLLGREMSGPANIRISPALAWQSINTALDKILLANHIERDDKNYDWLAGMGLAGCEVTQAYDEFLAHPHHFDELIVTSDAHTACLGAHLGRDGAIIIIGTGVVGFQIEQTKQTKVSGWGFPFDDQGSGAWLGLEAVKLTLQSVDERLPFSGLTRGVYAQFNNDVTRLLTWADKANSTAFAELAPMVIAQVVAGDTEALQLMQKAALAINRIGEVLMSSQLNQSERLPLALVGGLASHIEPYLSANLKNRVVPAKALPDEGAILLIKAAYAGSGCGL